MTEIGGNKTLPQLKITQQLMVRGISFYFVVFPFSVLDTSYKTLLSVFVGSFYVNVTGTSAHPEVSLPQNVITEDLVNTKNALGKYF